MGPICRQPPDQPALQRSAADFEACLNRSATRDEVVSQHRYPRRSGSALLDRSRPNSCVPPRRGTVFVASTQRSRRRKREPATSNVPSLTRAIPALKSA